MKNTINNHLKIFSFYESFPVLPTFKHLLIANIVRTIKIYEIY